MTNATKFFKRIHRVRFSETDYAGIMFYPRYIEALNDTIEDWFREVADCRFEELLDIHNIGSPLISLSTKFVNPNRLGDVIEFCVRIDKLGRSSIRFLVESYCDTEVRARSTLTHVCVKRNISKSTPWPTEVREKLVAGV